MIRKVRNERLETRARQRRYAQPRARKRLRLTERPLRYRNLIDQVGLVDDRPYGRRVVFGKSRGRVRSRRVSRIHDPKDEVGLDGPIASPPHALLLDRIDGLAKARGIEHGDGIAGKVEMDFDDVPRGTGKGRHDGRGSL